MLEQCGAGHHEPPEVACAVEVVDCGVVVVVVVVLLPLFEEEVLEAEGELPDELLDPELLLVVAVLVAVAVVLEPVDFVELLVEPGSTTARATAPATPDTPTAEVTAFIRARSRRRLRCGWSAMGYSVQWGPLFAGLHYSRPR
jgi:hypothetical protein